MPLGIRPASALSSAPPASSAPTSLLQLSALKLSHRASGCSRSSLVSDGSLSQNASHVAAASCSAIPTTADAARACMGCVTLTTRGWQPGTASSSGRPAETWPRTWAGLAASRHMAAALTGPSYPTAGLGCHASAGTGTSTSSSGTSSNNVSSVWSSAGRCASTQSVGHSLAAGVRNRIRCSGNSSGGVAGVGAASGGRSSAGIVCRSSRGAAGGGGALAGAGWGQSGAAPSRRCFSAAAWSPGGGGGRGGSSGGGSSSDDGAGLPPPIIISPVALRVVVIGWMGSNRRYLNKYGSLWARSGDHEVLIIRPSVAQTLVRWRGVVVAGRDIDRVARLHRENPAMPTIYHVFSTGGFIHAGTMWRWMDEVEDVAQRRDLLEEVRGIILDSAPAAVNPEMSARAIVSAVTNTPAEDLSYGMPGVQGALLNGTRSFMERYLRSKGVKLRTEEVYDAWYNLAPVCPQLYLYGDADPLVPTSDVEKYMGVQESRGVEVSGYKWPDSGHVEHYRRHPHEYAYQISAFLARALRDW